MLAVLLKILSIIGIVLLVLLGILLLMLLLVLFFPVTYRAEGEKNTERLFFLGRAKWLFGLLRVNARYENDFTVKVKLLMFTLYQYNTGANTKANSEDLEANANAASGSGEAPTKQSSVQEADKQNEQDPSRTETKHSGDLEIQQSNDGTESANTVSETVNGTEAAESQSFISAKIEKIKFTFREKYDKIKNIIRKIKVILRDLEYYKSVLEEKETRLLFRHVCFRLKKIWKAIKPRKFRADVLFGTGAPDTTGYAFAVYGMLSPQLGQNVCVTPDFNQAILEGNFFASGRVMIFTLLVQAVKVLLDKRLWLFIDKMKHITSENK